MQKKAFEGAIECLRKQDIEFGTKDNEIAIAFLETGQKVDREQADGVLAIIMLDKREALRRSPMMKEQLTSIRALLAALPKED